MHFFTSLIIAMCAVFAAGYTESEQQKEEPEQIQLKKLGEVQKAILAYAESNNGYLPMPSIVSKTHKPLLSWRVTILPYMGEQALYSKFALDEPWDSPHNILLADKMPAIFRDNDPDKSTTCIKIITTDATSRNASPYKVGSRTRVSAIVTKDGTDFTLGLIESAPRTTWTKPEDINIVDGVLKPIPQSPRNKPYIFAVMMNSSISFKLNLQNVDSLFIKAASYNDATKISAQLLSAPLSK